MRRLITTLTFLVYGIVLTNLTWAGDVEDVKAAYLRHITLSRTGEVDAFLEQHLPGHTAFGPDGGLLIRFDSLEDEKNFRQAAAASSGQQNSSPSSLGSLARQVRHLEVQIYGPVAVVTGYLMGPITLPDGSRRQGTRRLTSVWTKEGTQWREVHDHMSALVTMQVSQ